MFPFFFAGSWNSGSIAGHQDVHQHDGRVLQVSGCRAHDEPKVIMYFISNFQKCFTQKFCSFWNKNKSFNNDIHISRLFTLFQVKDDRDLRLVRLFQPCLDRNNHRKPECDGAGTETRHCWSRPQSFYCRFHL